MKIQIGFLFTLFFSQAVLAINTVDTGFKLAANELKTIVAHNTCKKVWNTSTTNPHFVSTKTNPEWMNFYANAPSDIVVRDCQVSCSTLNKTGTYPSGLYTIDIDGAGPLAALSVYCDMDNNGGGWTRIYKHNVAGGYFPSTNSALLYNQAAPTGNLYSIVQYIDEFENLNRFTFWINYPNEGKKNIWSQYTNPIYDTPVRGYRGIDIEMDTQRWGGLELGNNSFGYSNNDQALIDGSVNHSNWYFAIGSNTAYKTGIPSDHNNDVGTQLAELYLHDEGMRPMSCQHILELGESKGSGVYTIYPDQVTATQVYCEMDIDNGGWTLFYANAADPAMTTKKSYNQMKDEFTGINITATNYADINTIGMHNFFDFSATQMMARDIGNWGATDYSTVEFFNPEDFNLVVDIKAGPSTTLPGDCDMLTGGSQFRFRNSNGTSYYLDRQTNWAGVGFGWGDCLPAYNQTGTSDVHDQPRHYIYHTNGSDDLNRVRGVGGFNTGQANVKARYFLREKYDRPKNCMDILLSGKSRGNGSYTIYPEGSAVTVDCDMTTEGGGWTKVWHGYPTHAVRGDTSAEVYSRSNSIAFNQMRIESVNTGFSITDNTWETAYLDKTIPDYFQQVVSLADASSPQVKFADMDGTEDVELVGKYFFHGYGNNWRVFYSCVNVDPNVTDRIFIGGGYGKRCTPRDSMVRSDFTTCTSTGNSYCTDAYNSTEVESGLGLTLKQYQETRVWVRSLPSMKSCREILDRGYSSGTGIYIIDPDSPLGATPPFPTVCDMTTQGGGWTLVWGNTREGTNKPTTGLTYSDSINTTPRCSYDRSSANDFTGKCSPIARPGMPEAQTLNYYLEYFNYFVGLKHWDSISGNNDFQLLYSWSPDYEQPISQQAMMTVKNFDPADKYRLNIESYTQLIGSVNAAMATTHNGMMWSTSDQDNDNHTGVCATFYTDTPFWYANCWNGKINGGGEGTEGGYFNGAYWNGTTMQWATDPATAIGAGNGWFMIRESNSYGEYKSSCKQILEDNPNAPSGNYTINFHPGQNALRTVYCDMTTDGGGWTLVVRSSGVTDLDNSIMVSAIADNLLTERTLPNTRASINPEYFSRANGTTDAMFISPSYNGGAPIIENGNGTWDYDKVDCTGNLRHTSRTEGCSGQNANDNYNGVDAYNLTINGGNEGVVPAYGTEVCYSGKGACSFEFYLR
ncbi:fibrinogen-like YCDxxxxGGGW domain-containing protein [Halobacteriovorax sp. GFR7]|uniref:fibrinogen-like YCDxxxxGGGW domain-containing protein n=1 Tax=unclassified Halobacteriovorax TaxID=2639665 RepID=UPI003D962CD3